MVRWSLPQSFNSQIQVGVKLAALFALWLWDSEFMRACDGIAKVCLIAVRLALDTRAKCDHDTLVSHLRERADSRYD